ncbi:MAG: hypothetical protein KJO07_06240 [Deltaproteobacteria bacterium]|nr:hypothetical protein [Deltaproteobacteria bacterium]
MSQAPGDKCERCWRFYQQMSQDDPAICPRCAQAVAAAS